MTLGAAHVTRETSQLIFDDARRAFNDALHPCHRFVGMQRGVAITNWQLPAPFNGHSANAGIVFVRLNPSCDPKDVVPTIGSAFAEWDEFYRGRFDGDQGGWHRQYGRYQAIGEAAAGASFRLGTDAVVLEAVRFRSRRAQGCQVRYVLDHELPTTMKLLDQLRPRVVVADGAAAFRALRVLFPELPEPSSSRAAEGSACDVLTQDGDGVVVIPTRNLSTLFGYDRGRARRIGMAVRSALDGGSLASAA